MYKKINTCHVTTCNRDFYKQYRNSLQRVLRASKKTYYSQQCVDFKSNTKKLWGIINKVVNKSPHKQNVIDKLKIGNVTSGNASDIVEEFGKYYANIGKDLACKIDQSNTSIKDYIDKIPQESKTLFFHPHITSGDRENSEWY